ncbi:MAG TPA: molybdopterin-dependent oxidoreductase [Candidatus Limnocylindrales bacterium]|nr:molybdopterin-dependent oxidoreductase [Candidatus Limnocylindrales bacterium]
MTDRAVSRWRLAFAGIVAVGAAIATGELAAGLVPGIPSPLLSIGRQVVNLQPPGAKDFMASLFGTADKLVLQIVIVAAALLIGAVIGLLATRRLELAGAVVAVFAATGFVATFGDPDAVAVLAAAGAAAEALVGMWILNRLVPNALGTSREGVDGSEGAAQASRPRPSPATPLSGVAAVKRAGAVEPKAIKAGSPSWRGGARDAAGSMPSWSRRTLLQRGGAVAVGSIAATAVGRVLLERQRTPTTAAALPPPKSIPALPTGADLSIPGLTPIVVPNDKFYRIDTALIPPNVDVTTWKLKVTGMVDHAVELTYDELVQLPIIEQYVTIACVSNYVGGDLVGNTAWRGVPLRTVLSMAGVQAGATQLVGRSVDGFTVGMPTAWVMDESRTPMIAIGMNGKPLPREHGYPARLIVPGLYGYVSATKWLTELQLTTLEAFDAYWVPLGWAKEAPILTQSRIDVPQSGANVKAGHVAVAGVAWAPDRGVTKVEVAIDGAWHDARLSAPISPATWVQWLYDWDATAGDHQIEVRATDGAGVVQTADHSAPAPDGARGHHTIGVHVG